MDELQGFPYSPLSTQKLCVILLFKLSKNISIHKVGILILEKTRPSQAYNQRARNSAGQGLDFRGRCSAARPGASPLQQKPRTAETHRRGVWRGPQRVSVLPLCPHASSNGGAPGRTFLTHQQVHEQQNLSSGQSQARRGPLRTASASSNSGQQRHLCFRFSGSLSEPESKDPVKTL